jgi:hypothetical protein
MNLRIEEDLREKFSAAAEKNHRPAAQVIRDLMRNYVAENDAVAAFPRISEAEKAQRRENLEQSLANVQLEGLPRAIKFEAQAQDYVNGEISLDELMALSLDD